MERDAWYFRNSHLVRACFTDTSCAVRYRSIDGSTNCSEWENEVQFIVRKFPVLQTGDTPTHRMSIVCARVDGVKVRRLEWFKFVGERKITGISLDFHDLNAITNELDSHQSNFAFKIEPATMKRRGIQVLVHGSTLKISVINKDNDITTMSTLDEYEFQVSCKLLAALSVVLKAHHSPDEDFSIKCYEELFAITVFDICIKDTLLFEETSRDQLDELIDLNRLRLIDRMHDNFLTLKYMKGWVAGPEDEARVEKNLDIFPINDIYKLCNRQKARKAHWNEN